MTNPVLEAIKERRSIIRFETTKISEEQIQAILEAGRWAPSWLNKQPWKFIVVRDKALKNTLSEFAPTIYKIGIREAPICIVVLVNPDEDPYHFIEGGATATQNMALAAHSLKLGSCWIGTFRLKEKGTSSEDKIKEALAIPASYRVISLLPVGISKFFEKKQRKTLKHLVFSNKFGKMSNKSTVAS